MPETRTHADRYRERVRDCARDVVACLPLRSLDGADLLRVRSVVATSTYSRAVMPFDDAERIRAEETRAVVAPVA